MLPQLKTIINVECKQHLTIGDDGAQHTDSAGEKKDRQQHGDGALKSASEQLKKHARYIAKKHGTILDNTWCFVKVAAVYPEVTNLHLVCKHCQQYILTSHIKNKQQLAAWLTHNKIIQKSIPAGEDIARKQFINLFTRITNFSSITKQKIVDSSWDRIQGIKKGEFGKWTWVQRQGINAGHTPAERYHDDDLAEMAFNETFLNRPSDIYKLIYFNEDQLALLTADIPRLMLRSDYGSGEEFLFHSFL